MATNELDYGVIREPMRNGLHAAVNLLERDFPASMRSIHGLQPLLLLTSKGTTWAASRLA
jgi:hypothetical protein